MESQNLQTASQYINNLLLARGLLRNGSPVEFARPSKGEGGSEATMAKIINLREAEQRSTLASTVHNLRTTEKRNDVKIDLLQSRNLDLTRQLAIAQGRERASKTNLRTVEASARCLREEMQKLKTMLQQVRTACANDIRKRDVQIQRLKGQIRTQQRGTRQPINSTMTVMSGSSMGASSNGQVAHGGREETSEGAAALESEDYSLKQETTEFLTALSQDLSAENDNLIGLIKSSLTTLRALQGLPLMTSYAEMSPSQQDSHANSTASEETSEANHLLALPTPYETLATDMELVLEHLRKLLTNPSFVPIEEIEAREDEILRLREGWEKMEGRWREAVGMMDGWRKRMVEGGDTVNLSELKMGLGMGLGMDAEMTEDEERSAIEDNLAEDGEREERVVGMGEGEVQDRSGTGDVIEYEDGEVNNLANDEDSTPELNEEITPSPTDQPSVEIPLSETNSNICPSPLNRKVSFSTGTSKPIIGNVDENSLSSLDLIDASISKPVSKWPSVGSTGRLSTGKSKIQSRPFSSRSIPQQPPNHPSTPLTIQQKLALVKAEAEAASASAAIPPPADTGNMKVIKGRASGRKSRRKSTLSPDELLMLIGGV
ncbi:MAG: hypothetical protein M1827_006387 [Pycnora praestabilis]|nr:MAG: hypothetical protein M1827_006387 [Pycnora praestabilis]